ncbi:IS91 family transposase [Thiohalocapsa sp.]|uniref:IS91 family transposase n=1 Tax=Thiohalocapsa sp. TaxID=2497641 RepID=UPI0025DA6ED5|nr:IS91 family transposase [Thiohalocapsa sp.]
MTERTSLQAVIRRHLNGYAATQPLSPRQWQVCSHIHDCRTAAMGGLHIACDHCGYQPPHFFSCRDRHCPCCQHRATDAWCERQRGALLPVPYFHLVFTLPHQLDPWVERHGEVIYGLLFRVVWATLAAFGADPKRLDGQLGMTAVLHTWGQTLIRHVHLHCLVPGGALGSDGTWHPVTGNYLFPVAALSRSFRGRFVSALRQAYTDGKLHRIAEPKEVDALLDDLMATDWVVYAKHCLTHTETVVDYLGRYTHRIALSDSRLIASDGETVQLGYKDDRDGKKKVMTLTAHELIRRFLLHVLPAGFMRVRHFGFLANRCRAKRLAQIRQALDAAAAPEPEETQGEAADRPPCPQCGQGRLRIIGRLAPQRTAVPTAKIGAHPLPIDPSGGGGAIAY